MKPARQLKSSDIPKFRLYLLKKQKGICPLCNNKITDPVLDHSHRKRIKGTGLIRGVLCRTCNVFLAKAENNSYRYKIKLSDLPDVLARMSNYLKKSHLNFIHPSEKQKEPKLKKTSYNKLKKFYTIYLLTNGGQKGGLRNFPSYPKSGKLTVPLKKFYDEFKIEPEYYK